jgi:hypothetical protein
LGPRLLVDPDASTEQRRLLSRMRKSPRHAAVGIIPEKLRF